MTKRRGRPVRLGVRHWKNSEDFIRRIETILQARDSDDPETLTTATAQLHTAARDFLGEQLTEERVKRLTTLARDQKPSLIARTILCWRFDLPDRTMRVLQDPARVKIVDEFMWG